MFGIWLVPVVFLDDLIKKWGECNVSVGRGGINTDARLGMLSPGEDALLEGASGSILSLVQLIPNTFGEAFGEERFGSSWELWEFGDVLWSLEVRAHFDGLQSGSLIFSGWLICNNPMTN